MTFYVTESVKCTIEQLSQTFYEIQVIFRYREVVAPYRKISVLIEINQLNLCRDLHFACQNLMLIRTLND